MNLSPMEKVEIVTWDDTDICRMDSRDKRGPRVSERYLMANFHFKMF